LQIETDRRDSAAVGAVFAKDRNEKTQGNGRLKAGTSAIVDTKDLALVGKDVYWEKVEELGGEAGKTGRKEMNSADCFLLSRGC